LGEINGELTAVSVGVGGGVVSVRLVPGCGERGGVVV